MNEGIPVNREATTLPGEEGCSRDATWRKTWVLCAVLALFATILELFLTRNGVGVSEDSMTYLSATRGIIDGFGVSVPSADGSYQAMAHFPPFLPLVLAGPGFLGADPLSAVRWLNALMFGASAFLVGLVIYRHTRSCGAALGGAFLFILSRDMLTMHSMAWTEPSFIFLTLLSLALLGSYLETQKPGFIVGGACITGLAVLDRYAGVGLIWAGLAGILLLGRGKRRERIVACLIFGVIACLPMALWTLRNMFLTHAATDRPFTFHLIRWACLKEGLETASDWAFPSRLPLVFRVTASFLAFGGIVYLSARDLWSRRKRTADGEPNAESPRLPHLFILGILGYLALLLVSISFFDAMTTLDNRIMSPVYPLVLVSAVMVIYWILLRIKLSGRTPALVGFAIILLFGGGRTIKTTVPWVMKRSADGMGYTSRVWKESEILQRLRAFPEGIPIYSNDHDAIFFLTGRLAQDIPSKTSPMTLRPSRDFDVRLRKMEETLRRGNGIVVWTGSTRLQWYLPAEEELVATLHLRLKNETRDGRIYVSEPL